MLVRDRVSRIYYLKKFFDYPVSLKLETFTNMGLIRTIKAGFSYLKTIFVDKYLFYNYNIISNGDKICIVPIVEI